MLDSMQINYIENPYLVRGLDYYSHTVFEYITSELGAQGTVIAGGRYEKLFSNMGGGDVKSVGCALGLERLMELTSISVPDVTKFAVIAIGNDQDIIQYAMCSAQRIRHQNQICELYHGKQVQKNFKLVHQAGIVVAFIVGDEEMSNNRIKVKNFITGEELFIAATELEGYIQKL